MNIEIKTEAQKTRLILLVSVINLVMTFVYDSISNKGMLLELLWMISLVLVFALPLVAAIRWAKTNYSAMSLELVTLIVAVIPLMYMIFE